LVTIKKILAFVIDWNLILLPTYFLFDYSIFLVVENEKLKMLPFIIWGAGFLVVIFRDKICKGKSVGKRILKL
jgi:hypothetical protein